MAEQTFEIIDTGREIYGRLVVPYGLDPNGNPAMIEFTETLPGAVREQYSTEQIEESLQTACTTRAKEHERQHRMRDGSAPLVKRQKTLQLDVSGLRNTPLPQRDLGPDRDEQGRPRR